MTDESHTKKSDTTELEVAITKFPKPPSTPLMKDVSRLLALAAFIFSVSTGLYAAYQSWINYRDSTVESLSKIIDQYYAGQEKYATPNSGTQSGYINLLQSQLRSIAERTVPLALRVENDVGDGTWLALGQINDNEGLFASGQIAWAAAKNHTNESRLYTFAMRGLAGNLAAQGGKRDQAEDAFTAAIDSSLEDTVNETKIIKEIPKRETKLINAIPRYERPIEAAATHAFWLGKGNVNECSFVTKHFDAALTLLAEASHNVPIGDYSAQNQLVYVRSALSPFRKARQACTPTNGGLEIDDYCNLIANILDNAPFGFQVYKGYLDQTKKENWSRVGLSDTEFCAIDSRSIFYCVWPESDEGGTKLLTKRVVNALSACKNLGVTSVTESNQESPGRSLQTISMKSPGRPSMVINRLLIKPNEQQAMGRWELSLEIRAQIQQ